MIGFLYGLHSHNSEAPRVMTKPSRVFWAIGLLSLIWNAFGCLILSFKWTPGPWLIYPLLIKWWLPAAPAG